MACLADAGPECSSGSVALDIGNAVRAVQVKLGSVDKRHSTVEGAVLDRYPLDCFEYIQLVEKCNNIVVVESLLLRIVVGLVCSASVRLGCRLTGPHLCCCCCCQCCWWPFRTHWRWWRSAPASGSCWSHRVLTVVVELRCCLVN